MWFRLHVVRDANDEPNNTESTAYFLPVSFNNDNAIVQTSNANFHITSDIDYYAINLPPGYIYSIGLSIQNTYNSNNTSWGVYLYKNGTIWSDTVYTQASVFDITNGGIVYFKVIPYFSGDLGTYELDLSISRTCIYSDIPSTPSGLITLCQNPPNTTYTTTSAANALSYTWSISPSGAGTITGTDTIGTVVWNSSFIGTATIAVLGNNNCGAGIYSNPITVTVNACTDITENNFENNFDIYPNPANDKIEISVSQKSQINILDIEGQLIKTLAASGTKTNVDISALPCGVYVVLVKTEKGISVKKFIKE